jgi:hypothetical protein
MLAVTASAAIVYDSSDNEWAGVAPGVGTDHFQDAGNVTISATAAGANVSGRTDDYSSLDFKLVDCKAGQEYWLVVEFKAAVDTVFRLSQGTGPYDTYALSDPGKSATLTYNFVAKADGQDDNGKERIRIQTEASTDDYTIVSIKLYDSDPAAGGGGGGGGGGSVPADTGNAGVAVVISVMALAGTVAVVSRKRK